MNIKKVAEIFIYFILIVSASILSQSFLIGFLFIIIHELCHGLCAHVLGYNIKVISILPIGVTANIREEFIRPFDDIIISLSGPLINLIFFGAFYIFEIFNYADIYNLKEVNLFLFIFNMIPAEFLDGGRILKTVLKLYTSFYKAYIISIINGTIAGILILFSSIYTKSILNGIILFVVASYILLSCYKSKKDIIINVIKDIFMKSKYTKECYKLDVRSKAFSGEVNLLYIIKCFSFKKYYIIYLILEGSLGYKFCESDIIKIYCLQGNIKLKECMKYINT